MGHPLLKWLLLPVGAVALGYFVFGPRLAGDGRITKIVKKGAEIVRLAPGQKPEGEPDADAEAASGDEDAPRVSVGVKPVEERSERR